MNRRFASSLGFAVLAALLSIPWLLLLAPWLPLASALALFAQLAVAAYALRLAANTAQGLQAAMIALVCGGLLMVLPLTDLDRIYGAALTLAMVRSGFLYRQKAARAIASEAILGIGALLFGSMLFGSMLLSGTVLSAALSVWAIFLVHSSFFLIAATQPRSQPQSDGDRFAKAREEALELMRQA